jgi:hypothetical protein
MKLINCIVCFVIVLDAFIPVRAEEKNYWKPIKEAWEVKNDPNIGLKTKEYIESLSSEQLMMAGRQCAIELDKEFHRKGFAEGAGFLIAFFIDQYPKTASLEDLRPVFKDIEDPNQTDMWRSTLIHAFSDNWSSKIPDSQLREVADIIDKILASRNVYYRVINESLYTTKHMLQEIENRNMLQKSSADSNSANNQADKIAEIAAYYTRFSKRLLNIVSEPNLNPELQRVSFSLLRDILDKPLETKADIKNTLADAVRNYEKYDEKTWKFLLQIGIEKLQMPDGKQIAKEMTDKLEQKIKKAPNNNIKVPLQIELESVKQCMKKQPDK